MSSGRRFPLEHRKTVVNIRQTLLQAFEVVMVTLWYTSTAIPFVQGFLSVRPRIMTVPKRYNETALQQLKSETLSLRRVAV